MPEILSNNFNLVPEKTYTITTSKKIIDWAIRSGKKIIIITEIIVLISLFVKIQLFNNVKVVNEKIIEARLEILSDAETEEKFRSIAKDLNRIKAIDDDKKDWVNLFKIALDDIPPAPQVVIDSIDVSKSEIILSGSANSVESFGFLIQKYLLDTQIKKIILTGSQYDNDEKLYRFDITMEI